MTARGLMPIAEHNAHAAPRNQVGGREGSVSLLDPIERAILRMMVQGGSWNEVAGALGVSRDKLKRAARGMGFVRANGRPPRHHFDVPSERRLRDKAAYQREPEKFKARQAVRNAIKAGVLVKMPCEACGHEPTEAHHSDYSRPLEVTWLCTKCHRAAHKVVIAEADRVRWAKMTVQDIADERGLTYGSARGFVSRHKVVTKRGRIAE
jgi:transposase-like protein